MIIFERIAAFFTALISFLTGLLGLNVNLVDRRVDNFSVKSYVISDYIQQKSSLHSEDFDIITDVILFGCATFDAEGNVSIEKQELETALSNLREVIGERDVNITLNFLGPWGNTDSSVWDEQMEAQSIEHNKAFSSGVLEENIVAVLDEYDFDGVHFDYEYPLSLNAWFYYNNFLVSLDSKLGDYTIGVAVADWNIKFSSLAVDAVDSVELMMYDLYDEEGKHSTAENMIELAEKAALVGIPLSKVDFGLPFYARPTDSAAYWYDYSSYVDEIDDDGWYYDESIDKYFWFNTPEVIYEKTNYAINEGYGGVMVWHYTCDLPSTNEKSLTAAIGNAISDNYS